jgi:hypothetical protein
MLVMAISQVSAMSGHTRMAVMAQRNNKIQQKILSLGRITVVPRT